MDISEFEHGGGEFFQGGKPVNRKETTEFLEKQKLQQEALGEKEKDSQQILWLSIDNPFIWDDF